MNRFLSLVIVVFCFNPGFSQQKTIAITIDDVPDTYGYMKMNGEAELLDMLDSLGVPFTIFVNEGKVYQTDSVERNKQLLQDWIENERSLVGNHTYGHLRYSEVGFDRFTEDVRKGEQLSGEYAVQSGKSIPYFRFPFNDLGSDSLQHAAIETFLDSVGYIVAPFTIESSDWMYDYVYCHYLKQGDWEKAQQIGDEYVWKTMELVQFFERMSDSVYGRIIPHIYLCHDNALNAAFLDDVIRQLQRKGYRIESFETILKDPIYNNPVNYYKKWGISWMYRWMTSRNEQIGWMKQEPELHEIQSLYDTLTEK